MSARNWRAIGTVTFASVLLTLGVIAVPKTVFAADCLPAPNPSTPPNSHWYYRTDRAQQRKCWSLRADNEISGRKPATVTDKTALDKRLQSASSAPYSLESFKEFMAQQTGVTPSDQAVEKLYAEFLEWNRHTKN
ncbi:MAG TPA: hypothetical protein VHX43_18460 [Xanthobacteraceae bacterium]|jgi:hypothetical protein|nr:hypothetical protein [Xanthobacteraceae bacterium]